MADRESDFAEMFEAVQDVQRRDEKYAHIIVRSCHDRAIEFSKDNLDENSCDEEQKKLRSKLRSSKSLGEVKFTIPAATSRPARVVTQTLKSAKVTFKKRSTGKNSNSPKVTINVTVQIPPS